MIEVTSRRMECTLLTSNNSQMPAVVLQGDDERQPVMARLAGRSMEAFQFGKFDSA